MLPHGLEREHGNRGIHAADFAAHGFEHGGFGTDLQVDVHVRLIFLSKGNVQVRLFAPAHDVLPHVSDDSHDFQFAGFTYVLVHQDVFAKGVAIGPEAVGGKTVDDYSGPTGSLGGAEGAATQQGDPHGLEIVRIDDIGAAEDEIPLVGGVCAGAPYCAPGGSHTEGHGGGERGGLHAGQGFEAREQRAIGFAAARLIVAGEAGVEFDHDGVGDAESGSDGGGAQGAAREQAGRGQQGEREANLAHDEKVAAGEETPSAAAAALAILEVCNQVGTRQIPGGHEAEEQGAEQAEGEGGGQDAQVGRGAVDEIERGEARHRTDQHAGAGPGDEQSGGSACQGQHQAFDKKLLNDVAPPAAERQADGDFLTPGRAAGQHHIGYVERSDQQNHRRHGKQEDGGNREFLVRRGTVGDAEPGEGTH